MHIIIVHLKIEVVMEVGVICTGYNGDLTSRENGSVGDKWLKNDMKVIFVSFKENIRYDDSSKIC